MLGLGLQSLAQAQVPFALLVLLAPIHQKREELRRLIAKNAMLVNGHQLSAQLRPDLA